LPTKAYTPSVVQTHYILFSMT